MKPVRLPHDQFLQSFENVPRVAICLLVEREVSQTSKGVLLAKRTEPPFVGSWYYPGSFLLKGEQLEDAIQRVAKNELSFAIENVKLAGVFENLQGDPRGHVIDVIYRCRIKELNQGSSLKRSNDDPLKRNLQFFSKLPRDIGFGHREILRQLGYT